MKNIYCLNNMSEKGLKRLKDDYTLSDKIEQSQGILVRSAEMKEMCFSDELLAIARAGAGVNNIPLDVCADKGIVVFNTPGANANGVKELFLAGMLMSARDIVGGIEWCKENKNNDSIKKDAEKAKKAFSGTELKGKKLGVIGLGAIGCEIANTAVALGMEVYGYDPYISVNAAWNLNRNIKHIMSPDSIYSDCDYISIHVPVTENTKGMIGDVQIAQMKNTAVLLNYSRDIIVDEAAVSEALKNKKLRYYVTDFPNPLVMKMENVIVTPHLGASTEESEDNCAVMAVDELTDYIDNGNIRNSVNYPGCDMGICTTEARIAVLHKNIPNMLGQITAALAGQGANIADLTNKVRGDYAYALIDLNTVPSKMTIDKIKGIKGVCKVRVVNGGD
ncbi:MAG: phosphoglycerate dehydrogenase [Eubacteriales bacterium]|nr:phosphoglycerate dehydrogenase [Eubacteriales bacterium]